MIDTTNEASVLIKNRFQIITVLGISWTQIKINGYVGQSLDILSHSVVAAAKPANFVPLLIKMTCLIWHDSVSLPSVLKIRLCLLKPPFPHCLPSSTLPFTHAHIIHPKASQRTHKNKRLMEIIQKFMQTSCKDVLWVHATTLRSAKRYLPCKVQLLHWL